MAIDHRTAFCEVCDRETKQWKPAHRTLWNCDTCNSSNLDENGRYHCFNSLKECVSCDTFLGCLGRLDENLLERITRFREARERLEKQEKYVLAPVEDEATGFCWKNLDEGTANDVEGGTGEQEKVEIWLFSESGEGPGIFLFRLIPGRGAFWQPVTGRVETSDGSLEDAVLRELKEETGVEISRDHIIPLSHDFTYFNKERGILYHEHSFAVEVSRDLSPELSGEHTGWALFSPEDALDALPWPEQCAALERLGGMRGWDDIDDGSKEATG